MTKISAYPEITIPTIDDLLIGTDVENLNRTKNFSIQGIIDLAIPYKVYTAVLTQSGTLAPVATVLQNTFGGDLTWSYDAVGSYEVSSDGLFTDGKTTVTCSSLWGRFEVQPYPNFEESTFPNTVSILNINSTTGLQVNGIEKAIIEIKVYN